jgi:hypothetical protein
MATLADARKAALAPGGGGFYRRAKWVVGSQINAYNHTWAQTGEPASILVREIVKDDWIACDEDGEEIPSPHPSGKPIIPVPTGIDITGGMDPTEYVRRLRDGEPDTGALWEQAVEAEKADYFNHTNENVWDVLESVKDRVAVLKAERGAQIAEEHMKGENRNGE